MPRYLILFLAVASLVALSVWLAWPHSSITRENAARIHEGMTLEEVEFVLGSPERDETSGPTAADEKALRVPDNLDEPLSRKLRLEQAEKTGKFAHDYRFASGGRRWRSDEVRIVVLFDPAGCVTSCSWMPVCRVPETFFERLRRLLRCYL
jgi:hypothetical protein